MRLINFCGLFLLVKRQHVNKFIQFDDSMSWKFTQNHALLFSFDIGVRTKSLFDVEVIKLVFLFEYFLDFRNHVAIVRSGHGTAAKC